MEKTKIKIYITIEPYNIRVAGLFSPKVSVSEIRKFAISVLEKAQIKYSAGRLELKDKLAILLPEFKIGDFLNDESEVVLYSNEFGMCMRTLPGDALDQRVSILSKPSLLYDSDFLGKKREKDNKDDDAPNEKKAENKNKKDTEKQPSKEKQIQKVKPPSKEKSKKENKKDETKKTEENKAAYVSDSDDE